MRMNGMVRITPFTFLGMSNRVEHQKLNQVAAKLPPDWVSGVVLGLHQIEALIKTKIIEEEKCHQLYYFLVVICN